MGTRLIIVADVHLATGPLKPGAPDVSYAQGLLREAVDKTLALRPDQVILLGDVLNTGAPEEYDQAREILAPLAGRLEPLVGNHELLRGNLTDWKRFWRVAPHRQMLFGNLPAVLLNSRIEGLPLSQWGGKLDAPQLDLLDDLLRAQPPSPLLVFCHHPIAHTVRRSDKPMIGLDNSSDLETRLTGHSRKVVLFSGHAHYQSVVSHGPLNCIGAPSLCFWPHGLMIVDIDGPWLHFKTVRLIDEPARSPDRQAGDAAYRALAEGQEVDQFGAIPVD